MLGLMVSCIVHNTTTAMTVMPFMLIIQLVFAGSIFPLEQPTAKFLSNFSISNWGIIAVNTAADYNSQNSNALIIAVNSLNSDNEEDVIAKVKNVVNLPEVSERIGAYTASKLQKPEYEFTKSNIGKSWAILAVFALVYVLIGLLFLENIDKDKR